MFGIENVCSTYGSSTSTITLKRIPLHCDLSEKIIYGLILIMLHYFKNNAIDIYQWGVLPSSSIVSWNRTIDLEIIT